MTRVTKKHEHKKLASVLNFFFVRNEFWMGWFSLFSRSLRWFSMDSMHFPSRTDSLSPLFQTTRTTSSSPCCSRLVPILQGIAQKQWNSALHDEYRHVKEDPSSIPSASWRWEKWNHHHVWLPEPTRPSLWALVVGGPSTNGSLTWCMGQIPIQTSHDLTWLPSFPGRSPSQSELGTHAIFSSQRGHLENRSLVHDHWPLRP